MDKLDSELLQFIRQNAQMGTVTLTRLGEMLEAGFMKDTVTKQLAEYDAVFSEAGAKLEAGGEETKDVSHVVQAAATAMLGMQSLADRSPSHIAEIVIVGSTRGIIQIIRRIRDCRGASSDSVNLAYRLLVIEQNNINDLKRFL